MRTQRKMTRELEGLVSRQGEVVLDGATLLRASRSASISFEIQTQGAKVYAPKTLARQLMGFSYGGTIATRALAMQRPWRVTFTKYDTPYRGDAWRVTFSEGSRAAPVLINSRG